MPSSDSFLRQLSSKEGYWKSSSKRWGGVGYCGGNVYENGMFLMKKRVMVLVDQSSNSKHAMMWALTHVANKGDILTLLHILPSSSSSSPNSLAPTLASLCKASKPEVEVEVLVMEGPKMATVKSQVKKLEVSVLVLGQKKLSPFLQCLCLKSGTEEFVEQCINKMECLTIGVQKQSKGVSGYLISTRWHKNFWLLA
ncbi:uncharacterized protein [Henckelia pumila]|uniref:uncharacterized protein n=1 Tax=Henckelia pumila TaxID=405737 RepID=UPI003C6DF8BA